MLRRFIAIVSLPLIFATPAVAQVAVEIQPFVGGRFGGGFTVDEQIAGGGTRPVDINVASGFAWGLTLGFLVGDRAEFEFLWSRQESAISAESIAVPKTTLFDAAVSQYHGNVLFHFVPRDSPFRPYFLFGLGATGVDPDSDLDGVTKFSFGFGGGIKAYFSENVGGRVQLRWTPTYVSSQPELFCDIFLFCYAVNVADYLNQGELTAGLTFRF